MIRNNNRPLSDLGKFHYNLDKLLNNLESAYPDDPNLPYYKDKIMAVRKVNPKLVVEQYISTVENYIDPIMSQNEDFFLTNLNYDNLIEDNSYLKLLHKIRNLWLNMTENSRNMIWKYLQIFTTLGIIITKRTDLLPIINKYRKIPLTIK